MPESTTLVFVEGEFDKRRTHPGLTTFSPIAKVEEFPLLRNDELPAWITQRSAAKGVRLAPRALAALSQLIGPNLWMIENELDKLGAYTAGETVETETVAEVVTSAREARVWDLTDGIVEANERKALEGMRQLLAEGQPAPLLTFMVTRQFRQLAMVKDLRERGVRQDDMARLADVHKYRVAPLTNQSTRMSWDVIRAAYRRILDADLSVKQGLADDETALQLLIHDLFAMMPRSAPRAAYARR
jgi:DNA polymerase-3 subunit delta